jgi:DNA modification methylase
VIGGSESGGLLIGDALLVLPTFAEDTVTLWITSPPYFGLKKYGLRKGIGQENAYEEYLATMRNVCNEMFRASAKHAGLWMLVDHVKQNGTLKLLPFDIGNEAQVAGWTLRDVFIWNKHKALPWSRPGELRNGFEHILFLTKGDDFNFYVDRVRDSVDLQSYWIRYPERYNPRGKVPEGVWEFGIPTQGSWGRDGIDHPCPFPSALVERMILLSTDEGDLVVDPFAGTGAVVAQALAMGRRALGIELQSKYQVSFSEVWAKAWKRVMEKRHSRSDERLLENRIWKLRKLKFAREMLRLLRHAPGVARVRVAFVEERNAQAPCRQSIRIWLLTEEGRNLPRLDSAAQRLAGSPPLSKYQLDVEVVVTDSKWPWPAPRVWVYRDGRFWDCAAEVKSWEGLAPYLSGARSKQSLNRVDFPPLISTLRIQLPQPLD